MKPHLFFTIIALSFFCCKNKQKNTEDTRTEEQKTPIEQSQRTNDSESPANNTETATTNQTPAAAPTQSHLLTIKASNVTMRESASIQSAKIGTFEKNEQVELLETQNVENDKEAILTKNLTVKGSGGETTLPKGKAVVIEEYLSDKNSYRVTYEDPKKGKWSAEIDAAAVETITYSTWYRVKRANGETGWVLGKFLKTN